MWESICHDSMTTLQLNTVLSSNLSHSLFISSVMFFPSVHLILVCKSKCPKIMDTYQGEWGHCDNRYSLSLLSFHCCYWDLSWPGLLNYFLYILGALISFSHSLILNQQLIFFQSWSLVIGINLLSSQSCKNNMSAM